MDPSVVGKGYALRWLCSSKTPPAPKTQDFRAVLRPKRISLLCPENSPIRRKKSLLLKNNSLFGWIGNFDQNLREDKANLVSNRPLGGRNRENSLYFP